MPGLQDLQGRATQFEAVKPPTISARQAVETVGQKLGGVFAVVLIAVFAGAVVLGVGGVQYDFVLGAGEKALMALGTLAIVALFLERTIEVVVKGWRGVVRARIDQMVKNWSEIGKQARELVVDAADNQSVQARADLISKADNSHLLWDNALEVFRSDTRKWTYLVGLLAGFLIAAVGPRLLQGIVEPLGDPAPIQETVFVSLDVFVTGGLIGGGADGIHRLVALITEYLESVRTGVKAVGQTKQ